MPRAFARGLVCGVQGDELKEAKGQENKSKSSLAEKGAGKLLSEVVVAIRTVASTRAHRPIRALAAVCAGSTMASSRTLVP